MASITCLGLGHLDRFSAPNKLLLHITSTSIYRLQHGRKHRACHALRVGAQKEEEKDAR